MNTLRKNVLIALTALGIAGAAVAQTTAVQPAEGRHGHAVSAEQRAAFKAERQAKRAERQAQHEAKLRAELKLTPQQEPAFAAFVAAGKPAQRADGRGADHARLAALPAPQRLQQRIERQKQRTARMEARLAALNNLYAVLTPEQKQVLDSKAMQFGGKDHGHRGGRHGGHGGQQGERGAALQS